MLNPYFKASLLISLLLVKVRHTYSTGAQIKKMGGGGVPMFLGPTFVVFVFDMYTPDIVSWLVGLNKLFNNCPSCHPHLAPLLLTPSLPSP